MKFEKSLNRLEKIVQILEQGDRELEEVLKLFEEGSKLLQDCSVKLSEFENKIEILSNDFKNKLILRSENAEE